MDDLKELFDSLDRLEAPDLWLEADRRRPGAVRLGRDRSRLLAAVVAFAVAIPAVFLAIRAFQAPEEPVAPVRSPSASTTEARCPQATTSGDFDGDGTADEATFFEIVPQGVTCAQGGQVVTHLLGQEVVIWFGSGIVLRQPFTDCRGGECAFVFAATDLDDDGRDELAIDVTSAGAIGLVEFYRVDPAGIPSDRHRGTRRPPLRRAWSGRARRRLRFGRAESHRVRGGSHRDQATGVHPCGGAGRHARWPVARPYHDHGPAGRRAPRDLRG